MTTFAKTALVTGASRGIGRATAQALAKQGVRILVHYGNSAKEADSLVNEIREADGQAEAIQAELGTSAGPAMLAKHVRTLVGGHLDILVSNAGNL